MNTIHDFEVDLMTHRHYDTHIRIKHNALIQGLYSGRSYTASDELECFEFMACLEHGNYVFQHPHASKTVFAISPDDVEIIDYD